MRRSTARAGSPRKAPSAFLRALAEQEGAAGTLRLGIARKDGRPVAAQLWLVENGEATIHKLAYARGCEGAFARHDARQAMFRRALDVDRVAAIDYGTGDDPYKRDWMAERRAALAARAPSIRARPRGLPAPRARRLGACPARAGAVRPPSRGETGEDMADRARRCP